MPPLAPMAPLAPMTPLMAPGGSHGSHGKPLQALSAALSPHTKVSPNPGRASPCRPGLLPAMAQVPPSGF